MIIHDITRLIVLLGFHRLFLVRNHMIAQGQAQEDAIPVPCHVTEM